MRGLWRKYGALGLSLLTALTMEESAWAQAARAPSVREAEAEVIPPTLILGGAVPYPEGAVGDAIVELKLLISETGRVREVVVVRVTNPEPKNRAPGAAPASQAEQELFVAVATTEVKGWQFTSARVEGVSRAAWIKLAVQFIAPVEEEAKGEQVSPEPATLPAEPVQDAVVQVMGARRAGRTRVLTDAETLIIPGAEGDPLRSIEAMPGTVPILASGPFIGIRGGSPGMSGYQYDGIKLPYLFHLARGTAVVHPWMVESAALYGTGGPARLGGAGAGTLEATAAAPEGRIRASARIRLTDSALGVETPFAGGRGSFMAAGRYSYTKPLVGLIAPEFTLNYWDYQARVRYQVSKTGTVEVLSLGAGDRSAQTNSGVEEDIYNASFHRASLRYIHETSDGASQRISLTYGHDRWDAEPSVINPFSHEITVRLDGTAPRHDGTAPRGVPSSSAPPSITFGGDVSLYLQNDNYFGVEEGEYTRQDVLVGSWVDVDLVYSERTDVSVGVRADLYATGAAVVSEPASDAALSPRLAISHKWTSQLRLHTSAGLTAQRPSSAQRPPGREYSLGLGLERGVLSDFGLEYSLPLGVSLDTTGFHNAFFNVKDAEHLEFLVGQVEDPRAQGQAVGLEVSLKRMLAEHLRGFLSYTLSRSWRSIGRVSALAQYDRGHVVDAALAYFFGRGWSASSRATYYTGIPYRVGRVDLASDFGRASDYFQLDAQVAKRWDLNQEGAWWGITLGILNATLSSDVNDAVCSAAGCAEELVGPATIPTIGVEGEL